MSSHNDLGKNGEKLAAGYLTGKGFTVLHTNWRFGRFEIDIIATLKDTLHFVEVKTRSSATFGQPEEGVTRQKMKQLMLAAEAYILQNPGWKWVQHDILSISIYPGKEPKYFFTQDVWI